MDIPGLRPEELRTLVLSHGHADHHGGPEGLFQRVGRRLPAAYIQTSVGTRLHFV